VAASDGRTSLHKAIHHLLLIPALLLVVAAPALGNDVTEGDGYSVRLPPGFQEARNLRDHGRARIQARFGSMPLDGAPDVKAFIDGATDRPSATLLLARVDLKSPIHTHQELGLHQLEAMDARAPEGFDFQPIQVGSHDAVQMEFSREIAGEGHTTRVLSIACGTYIVVMMLDTVDERYRGPEETWIDLVATIRVRPRSKRLVIIGLIALGCVLVLGSVIHFSRRSGTRGQRQRGRHVSSLVLPGSGGAPYAPGQVGYRGS
jgi:hypothetical protein